MNPSVKCIKCNNESSSSLLVCFRFYHRHDKPTYDFIYADFDGPMPKDSHTVQDDKIVCNKCCGFGTDKPRPQAKMEGHQYTWIDGTESYCAEGHLSRNRHEEWLIRNIKELKREVKQLKAEVKRLRYEQRKDAVPSRVRRTLYQRDIGEGREI